MKIHDRIKELRTAEGLSLKELHEKIVNVFGRKALSYDSLSRIENGRRVSLRMNTLYQISTALGINIRELKKGTEIADSGLVNIIRNKDKSDKKFIYNDNAYAIVSSPKDLDFMVMELHLSARGKTHTEQDPVDDVARKKLIIVNQGSVSVHVAGESHNLRKNDSISFNSALPHYVENNSAVHARCTIIQDPKSY